MEDRERKQGGEEARRRERKGGSGREGRRANEGRRLCVTVFKTQKRKGKEKHYQAKGQGGTVRRGGAKEGGIESIDRKGRVRGRAGGGRDRMPG